MSQRNFFKGLALFVPLLIATTLWADSALAQTPSFPEVQEVDSLGGFFCNVFSSSTPFSLIFQWFAYFAGVMSALRGVNYLRLKAEAPDKISLTVPLMYLFGAMCLLALPSFIGAVEKSFFKDPAVGSTGLAECSAGVIGTNTGLDGMLANFVGNIKEPLIMVVAFVAVLCGLFMIVNGLVKASKYGTDPKTYSIQSILTNIAFGSLLMTLGANLDMMMSSLFGIGYDEVVANTITWKGLEALLGGTVSEQFKLAVTSALTFVQLIGLIAFVRGWLILKKVVEGGGGNVTLAQGLTHIIGGCLAININGFLVIMDKTFGTNLL